MAEDILGHLKKEEASESYKLMTLRVNPNLEATSFSGQPELKGALYAYGIRIHFSYTIKT